MSHGKNSPPELTLAGKTIAQFVTEKQIPSEVQQRIDVAKAQYKGLINERNQANKLLRKTVVSMANAVRGDASHGLDSNFYRSLGFITSAERKRPVRRPKAVATPMAAAAVPIPPSANVA